MMPDHDALDRRLRDAGNRLRDTAPSVAATEAALDTLDVRLPPSRLRWIAPLAFVAAAAAAVVGVLVVTRPEESGRVVPADTGPPVVSTQTSTTAAPTTTAAPATTTSALSTTTTASSTTTTATTSTTSTTPTTSTMAPPPPPVGAAFVGDLPLDASAAIVGCPGTFGDLAAAIPELSWPIVSLACAGDFAVVASSGGADGTWHVLRRAASGAWAVDDSGTSHPCDPALPDGACVAFGNPEELYGVDGPLPTAWIVEDPKYLPATDATELVGGLGVSVAGDAEAFATELGAALQAVTSGDPVPRVETTVLDDVHVVTVTLNGIPDDSSSRLTYVVRYADVDGSLTPAAALGFTYCNRGVTNDGLCL